MSSFKWFYWCKWKGLWLYLVIFVYPGFLFWLGVTCNPPCNNNGTCVNRRCVCPEGFTGPTCLQGKKHAINIIRFITFLIILFSSFFLLFFYTFFPNFFQICWFSIKLNEEYNLFLTCTPICIKQCILSAFLKSLGKNLLTSCMHVTHGDCATLTILVGNRFMCKRCVA